MRDWGRVHRPHFRPDAAAGSSRVECWLVLVGDTVDVDRGGTQPRTARVGGQLQHGGYRVRWTAGLRTRTRGPGCDAAVATRHRPAPAAAAAELHVAVEASGAVGVCVLVGLDLRLLASQQGISVLPSPAGQTPPARKRTLDPMVLGAALAVVF